VSSPGNYRPDVTDVVLIFTDGEPIRRRGEDKFGDKYNSRRYGEGLLAKDRAQSLREKDVTVVGLAVGTEVTLSRFRDDIKEWTTEGKYFETNKDSLQNIMNELISASCIDPGKQGGHRRPGNGYLVQYLYWITVFIFHITRSPLIFRENRFNIPCQLRWLDIVITKTLLKNRKQNRVTIFTRRSRKLISKMKNFQNDLT
jgi:hypothetical protein